MNERDGNNWLYEKGTELLEKIDDKRWRNMTKKILYLIS
jgi:hypothetical protein